MKAREENGNNNDSDKIMELSRKLFSLVEEGGDEVVIILSSVCIELALPLLLVLLTR